MREIIACYVESVKRLDEKKCVGKAGENNGQYCWSGPCIPDGYGNGKQEQRICHIAEVEALQKKRPPERHGDGKRRETIAKEGRAGNLQFEVLSGHGSPRLDRTRAGFRNRLSEEKDHTAEASARRGSGVCTWTRSRFFVHSDWCRPVKTEADFTDESPTVDQFLRDSSELYSTIEAFLNKTMLTSTQIS